MKRLFKEKGLLIFTFIIFYTIIELVTFRWLGLSLLPRVFLLDLLILFIFAFFSTFFKSHKASIYYLSFLFFLVLSLAFINQTMNLELNGEVFSLTHLKYTVEATNVFSIDFIHIDVLLVLIATGLTYGYTMYIIYKLFLNNLQPIKFYYRRLFPIIGFLGLALLTLFNTRISVFADYNDLFNVSLFKRDSIEKYGMFGYYYKEADIMFFDSGVRSYEQEDLESELVEIDPYKKYDENNQISYNGLLEGKNVITIMIETGQGIALNEYLTPNMYRMTQEGLYFPNHYSENKTNMSEFIGILGNFPSNGVNADRFDYDFSYSMPDVLKEEGYNTAYFHENLASFYDRGNAIPEFGFENTYLHEELFPDEPIYGWGGDYTLDSRTMDVMLDYMFLEEDQPFYYFWSTLIGHGPYNSDSPSNRLDGKNNKQMFEELGYFALIDQAEADGLWENPLADDEEYAMRFRHYQAAMMDFDVSLGMLLQALEEEELLDDTIIIMYGDHNAYYDQMHLKLNDSDKGDIHKVDMYKTFFAVYNPILTKTYKFNNNSASTTIDKFVSPYDILPTYYQLLGINYYDNFVFGESVLSNKESIFYSHKITAFFNNEYFSFNNYSIFYPSEEELESDISELDFILKTEEFSEKILWLELWIAVTKTEELE
ncbi:MAG: LTA synthase family protein [Bacillota bacterium]